MHWGNAYPGQVAQSENLDSKVFLSTNFLMSPPLGRFGKQDSKGPQKPQEPMQSSQHAWERWPENGPQVQKPQFLPFCWKKTTAITEGTGKKQCIAPYVMGLFSISLKKIIDGQVEDCVDGDLERVVVVVDISVPQFLTRTNQGQMFQKSKLGTQLVEISRLVIKI